MADIVAKTRSQNARLDELCSEADRDPATLRRQFLLWDTTDPLAPGASVASLVEQLTAAGIEDFVLGWSTDEAEEEKFETEVLLALAQLSALAHAGGSAVGSSPQPRLGWTISWATVLWPSNARNPLPLLRPQS